MAYFPNLKAFISGCISLVLNENVSKFSHSVLCLDTPTFPKEFSRVVIKLVERYLLAIKNQPNLEALTGNSWTFPNKSKSLFPYEPCSAGTEKVQFDTGVPEKIKDRDGSTDTPRRQSSSNQNPPSQLSCSITVAGDQSLSITRPFQYTTEEDDIDQSMINKETEPKLRTFRS
ncbi:unnamed protein product [Rotaria sordida]|uniref:Uncharacterized protein n=1 Tax=Rotaria sordida TaxID=392033 RepID=A0A814V531_9BILA|nr:unnamed protein product [Rotaria sordida]CAF1446006.1 unnamed protein product [Rotaria sordida]